MEDLNIDKIVKDQFNPIQEVQSDIHRKYPQQSTTEQPKFILPSTGNEKLMGGTGMGELSQKPSFSRQVPVTEAYNLVGDEWMKKFPTYKQGSDNAEYAAQNQSGWEQTVNGISKAGLNIGSVIAGNTAGFVYGLTDWAKTGNFSSVYDNSFSQTLNEWNEKLGYQLPNYYTKQEKDMNFFQKATTANFWANDVANGLSFTLGTIASEAIWAYATGGASIAARMGRWGAKIGQGARLAENAAMAARVGEEAVSAGRFGKALLGTEKVAEGLANYKGFVYKALDNAVTTGKMSKGLANGLAKTGEILNTTRFIATSSGNEAGIEAFHFKKEATENYYRDFERLNGRPPTAEESAEAMDKIEGAANWTFASNMAILGVSNLAMLGSLFKLKSPIGSLQKAVNQKLFGIGVKEVEVGGELVMRGLERKAWQKAAGYLYKGSAPIVREGMFEEGLQGATTKTANHWIERQYDPKYLNKVMSLGDDAWKAMGEQYGTKEGWNEIGIGGVVGLLGGIRVAGRSITHEISDFSRLAEEQEKVVAKSLNAANVTMKTFVSDINAGRMMTTAKIMESEDRAERAMAKKDVVSAKLAHNDSMIALAEMYDNPLYGTGGFSQMERHGNNMIDTTEVSEEEKNELKAGFKSFINEYKSASTFANSIVGSQGKVYGTDFQANDVKKALTYTILQGQSSKKMMDESLTDFGNLIGKDYQQAIQRNEELQTLDVKTRGEFNSLKKEKEALEKRSEKLQEQIKLEQISVKKGRESKAPLLQREILDIEKRKQEVNASLETIASKIATNKKLEQSFKGVEDINMVDEFISVDELLRVEKDIDKLEEAYKTLKSINPISAQMATEHMANYKKAQQALLDHNTAIKLIASGNFKPKLTGLNPFSGLYDKFSKGEIDKEDHTSEFLTRLGKIRESFNDSVAGEGQKKEVERAQVKLDELNALETLTEEQIAEKTRLEKLIVDLSPKVEEVVEEKDDTPKRKETETPKELTTVEALKARIEDILKLFKSSFIGTYDVDEAVKKRPDQKDVDRYNELLSILDGKATTEQKEQAESEPRTETEIEVSVPINKIVDSINSSKRFVYNGIVGFIKQDGQQIVFESENGLNIYELGNIDDLQNTSLNEFDIQEEATLQIDLSDDLKTVTIRGKKYTNGYSDPMSAITKTKDGYTVTLENEKGQKRNFRGQIADQIVYELYLKQFEQNATEQDIEQATNDVELQAEIEQLTIIRKKYGIRKVYAKTERKQSREELLEEFTALKEKLSQWRVYDSLAEDEQSVADLLNIVAQLETEVEQQNTLSEPNVEDVFTEAKLKPSETVDLYDLSVNTNFPVTVKREASTGKYTITHMHPSSLLTRLGATDVKINEKVVSYDQVNKAKKKGVVVTFMSGGVKRKFTVEDRGRLSIAAEDFNAIPNVKTIESLSSWSYPNLYERDFEGKWNPIGSDFGDDTITGDSFKLKEGDILELVVDVNNGHNKTLLETYKKSKDEDKVKTVELANQVVIYIRKNGHNYGTIKGIPKRTDPFKESEHKILKLRDLAGEMLTKGKSGVVATSTVTYVQLGNPILSINGDGKIAQNKFTESAIKNVVDTGYVLDGEIVLSGKTKADEVRRSYIKKIAEKNKGKKVPIVVIKRENQLIAFPVSMIKRPDPKTDDLNAILYGQMTDAEKVSAINNLLIANGIAPKEFNLITLNEDKVNQIAEKLEANQDYLTAEQLANNYEIKNLVKDATIALDLVNIKVSLPSQKFNIDMEGISFENLPEVKVEPQATLEKVVEKATETATTSASTSSSATTEDVAPKVRAARNQVNSRKTSAKPKNPHTMEFVIDDVQLRQLPKTLVNKIKRQSAKTKVIDYTEKERLSLEKAGVRVEERNVPTTADESKVDNAKEISESAEPRPKPPIEINEDNIEDVLVEEMNTSIEELKQIAKKIVSSGLTLQEYVEITEDVAEKQAILADLGIVRGAITELEQKPKVEGVSKPTVKRERAKEEEEISTVNLLSFETTDLAGTKVTYYKRGDKWGYIDKKGRFDSLVLNAQPRVEKAYQAYKESIMTETEEQC